MAYDDRRGLGDDPAPGIDDEKDRQALEKGGVMNILTMRGIMLSLAPAAAAVALAACTTVKLEGGEKPIEVNLNVKIDQEVRVKLDREIEDLIADNPDIF